jgi:signal peptidase I
MKSSNPWLRGEVLRFLLMMLTIGDHRGRSLDGRYFGLVPESAIYGKALAVYRRRDEGFVWRPL